MSRNSQDVSFLENLASALISGKSPATFHLVNTFADKFDDLKHPMGILRKKRTSSKKTRDQFEVW